MAIDDKILRIKPEDNLWIYFKNANAVLNVLGSKEIEIHGRPSQLHYGIDKNAFKTDFMAICEEPAKLDYIYVLPLSNLVKTIERKSNFGAYGLSSYEMAIKTDKMLQITRVHNLKRGYANTSVFSGEEYKKLFEYLNLEKNKKREVLA